MKSQGAKKPTEATNLNVYCPCGSGKKFKHCCMGKPSTPLRESFKSGLVWKGFVLLILLIGIVVLLVETGSGRNPAALDLGSIPSVLNNATPTLPFGQTPEPWFYDTVNNQHWVPGHEHWHSGPPPPPAQRLTGIGQNPTTLDPGLSLNIFDDIGATLPSGQTPEPWFYDTVNNQHWVPGHEHWHSGPPPPPAERP